MAYAAIGLLAIILSLGLLAYTKIPAIVMPVAATLAVGALALYARVIDGYWGPLSAIAFVFAWFYAAIVSLAFLGIGRWLKWPYFLDKQAQDTASAL
jgi:hypothetical protein